MPPHFVGSNGKASKARSLHKVPVSQSDRSVQQVESETTQLTGSSVDSVFKTFLKISSSPVLPFTMDEVFGKPKLPCYFIFGDSLFDSGNNNGLTTSFKANYPPYGIDFPQGVTGRFTNGRTIADILGDPLSFLTAELLEFDDYIPAYATATHEQISTGVNYASGGAGIQDETGSHLGGRICLNRQLFNHHTIVSRLLHLQRNMTFTNEYLSKCLYIVNIGSNDYINNYLVPTNYATSQKYTTYQYAKILSLYDLGGRKIVVFGLGRIGCSPAEISIFGTGGEPCVEFINDAAEQYNNNLKLIVDELNFQNPEAKFTFINVTGISSQQGIGLTNVPCCILRSDGQCAQTTSISPIRSLSMFYDGFHPTEAANILTARRSYMAISPMDASPFDISHLGVLKEITGNKVNFDLKMDFNVWAAGFMSHEYLVSWTPALLVL
ncbi:SGNH hydrolase-type esterase domain-containing protein [Artemisia annua]|uniref:SGNH hydrolase-type esterase domain-containing protein n=1 Tax=Artemisia annua TaxID=35608 RepID=A0A2U1NLN2_ARTAN|nr:SGNH hydrolase-type esterase domain-containing protein [Artemisia annua]